MKRLFLPTISVFLICFFGGMSLAPAVKDSKARLGIVSQWVPLSDDAGYEAWKKEADKRKKAVADAAERLKQAEENEITGTEMKALMDKIGDFEAKFKAYSRRTESPEHKNLLRTKTELAQAKDEYDKARKNFLESGKFTFVEKRDLYDAYSKALAEYNGKLGKLPGKEVKP